MMSPSLPVILSLVLFLAGTSAASSEELRDCSQLAREGAFRSWQSVNIDGQPTRLNCIQTSANETWTLVQKRDDGRESFWNRTWLDYKIGFGNPQYSSYWLGLAALSRLASSNVTMRFELWGDRAPGSEHANDYYWSDYIFSLEPESAKYAGHFSYSGWSPAGNASTGWYDLSCSDGAAFSTVDRVNDPTPRCVTDYHLGGWWLRNCAFASLNGEYVPPIEYGNGYGLMWIVNGEYTVNPTRTRIMIRRD